MIKSITEIVPFGQDDKKRPLSVMYLANVGKGSMGGHSYLIGYYEKASYYSDNKDIRLFKYITGYDRNQSTFNLLQEIYSSELWSNCVTDGDIEYLGRVVEAFDSRAMKDIGF